MSGESGSSGNPGAGADFYRECESLRSEIVAALRRRSDVRGAGVDAEDLFQIALEDFVRRDWRGRIPSTRLEVRGALRVRCIQALWNERRRRREQAFPEEDRVAVDRQSPVTGDDLLDSLPVGSLTRNIVRMRAAGMQWDEVRARIGGSAGRWRMHLNRRMTDIRRWLLRNG